LLLEEIMPDRQIEILLVEDNPDDVELTLHALRKEKLANHIHVARDGEEAIEFLFCSGAHADRLFDQLPKLVLLDLKLPKVDGMEVLKRLKSDPRTQTIPVVILTSSKEERDLVQGYGLGANSYIQKPVDFDQFRDTVKRVGFYWLLINQPPVMPRLRKVRHTPDGSLFLIMVSTINPAATSRIPLGRSQARVSASDAGGLRPNDPEIRSGDTR
jgi:two-component system, response regulator